MAVGPKEMVLKPAGVVTDPNPHSAAPAGAMRKASNCIMERDGILQPRPGFGRRPLSSLDVHKLIPFDGDMLVVYENAASATIINARTEWHSDGSPVEVREADTFGPSVPLPLAWYRHRAQSAQSRGNLYLSTVDGVRKLSEAGQPVARFASATQPYALAVSGTASGSAIAPGQRVAYRTTVRVTDPNRLVVTSPASSRLVVHNNTAPTVNPTVRVYLPSDAQEGDVVELYRSRNFADTPDDELYLAGEAELSSADVSNGYASVLDSTADSDLGRALYTNPSVGGALVANQRPMAAKDLAMFRGSMFFADLVGPRRIALQFREQSVDPPEDEIGVFGVGVTFTNGASIVTGISPGEIGRLRVGQLVNVGDGSSWSGTESQQVYVAHVDTTWAALSRPYTGSTGPGTLIVADSIRIGTRLYAAHSAANLALAMSGQLPSYRCSLPDPHFFAYAVGDGFNQPLSGAPVGSTRRTVVIEQRRRAPMAGVLNRSIWASNGERYTPALPATPSNITSADPPGKEIEGDTLRNGLQWSKQDQPEHVPEVNVVRVGSESEPIQRIVPIRDALIIFKTDGVWRLTGMGPDSGWRIDPLDMGTALIVPETAQVLNEAVFGWTNRGVVRVTESDVTPVSTQYIGRELLGEERMSAVAMRQGAYGFAVAVEDRNSYAIGVPASPGVPDADRVWVWNTKTMAWTTWELPWRAAAWNPADGLLYGATSVPSDEGGEGDTAESHLRVERRGTVAEGYDDGVSVGISLIREAFTVGEITIEAGIYFPQDLNPEAPTVGSLLVVDGYVMRLTSVEEVVLPGPTVFWVAQTTGDLVELFPELEEIFYTAELFLPFLSTIEFTTRTAGAPSIGKHWRHGVWMFEQLRETGDVVARYSDGAEGGLTDQPLVLTMEATDTPPDALRSVVPRAHARSPHLFPRLDIRGGSWELSGITISYIVTSARARRGARRAVDMSPAPVPTIPVLATEALEAITTEGGLDIAV